MRLMTAFRVFFAVLFDRAAAERIVPVLKSEPFSEVSLGKHPEDLPSIPPAAVADKAFCKSGRSEAVTLLAVLQREARLLDFLMEKLDGYDDALVGAAARKVHDDCAAVIERLFDVQPLRAEDEMSQMTIETPDPSLVQLVGNVSGEAPYTGRLTHHGWVATKCELPTWSGATEAALVLAPAEVEMT
ncbi:MAG: DUF2760 domain-containing protein [Planctomycetaceae bacterium]|nr:DUF2760 domain-containing protein [Planctomycetaceae bacterium]